MSGKTACEDTVTLALGGDTGCTGFHLTKAYTAVSPGLERGVRFTRTTP